MNVPFRAWTLPTVLIVFLAAATPQAYAQYSDSMGGSFNNPISSGLSSQIWGNLQMQQNLNMQRMLMQQSQRRRQGMPAGRTAPTTPKAGMKPAVTTFTPVAAQLVPGLLAAQMGKTPAQRQQFEKLFGLCLQLFDYLDKKQAPVHKVVPHDVAVSLAYYLTANYEVYTGKDVTAQQYEAVCRMVRNLLTEYPAFQAADDRRRQQLHETLAIMGSLPALAYQQAQQSKNASERENARRLAAANLQNLGFAPDQLQITDAGLVVKSEK